MFGEKGFLKSKTIQGILAAAIGYAMSQGWIPEIDAEALAGHLTALIGFLWAAYGRQKTKGEKLTLK